MAASAAARASADPYVPVTRAEREQTRTLVAAVLVAHRRGEAWRLCELMSRRWIQETFGTRERCRRESRRRPPQPCAACTYRKSVVLGIYQTAEDRRQKRKTIGWIVAVTGDPRFRGKSSLELRFRRERGRWVLNNMLVYGVAR